MKIKNKKYIIKQTNDKKEKKQMNTMKFKQEGWNHEITQLEANSIDQYISKNEILQGLVSECDDTMK